MSITYYMDENVHRSITSGLRLRGVDVVYAQEDGRTGAPDDEILDRATKLGRVLFSQDDDLLAETKKRQLAGENFSGLIYAHQLHVTIGECVRDLELFAKAAEAREMTDMVFYLPL